MGNITHTYVVKKKKKNSYRYSYFGGDKEARRYPCFLFSISLTNTPLVLSLIIFIYSDFIILFKV